MARWKKSEKMFKEMESSELHLWIERAEKLIADPQTYNYDEWGLGSAFVYGSA